MRRTSGRRKGSIYARDRSNKNGLYRLGSNILSTRTGPTPWRPSTMPDEAGLDRERYVAALVKRTLREARNQRLQGR